MASRLESLPGELFDEITAHLDYAAVTALLRCNGPIRERIETRLYSQQDVQSKAMRWACEHDNDAIVRALVTHYGAPVSAITDENSRRYIDPDSIKVPPTAASRVLSTLYIALTSDSPRAARTLLNLGARVSTKQVNVHHVEQLLTRLLSRRAWASMRLFLEARFQAWVRNVKAVDRMLLAAAKAGGAEAAGTGDAAPPGGFVHFLLDRKACPNLVQAVPELDTFMCPLSAAVFARSASMVRLLLSRGADIHGAPMNKKDRYLTGTSHIPIFAAVQVMAEEGPEGRDMVQLCLDNGADINQCAVVRSSGNVTPVLIYLRCIRDWGGRGPDPAEVYDEEDGRVLRLVDGLSFLLEKGALIKDIPDEILNVYQANSRHKSPPRALDLLDIRQRRRPNQINKRRESDGERVPAALSLDRQQPNPPNAPKILRYRRLAHPLGRRPWRGVPRLPPMPLHQDVRRRFRRTPSTRHLAGLRHLAIKPHVAAAGGRRLGFLRHQRHPQPA